MKLGVVSDTHAHLPNTHAAIRMLESMEVDLVVHCGDIGAPEIVPLFAPWPTHFVFGNVDDRPQALRQAIAAAGQTCHERFGTLEVAERRIAFLHSDDERRFRETIRDGAYDLVCYGHTHVARQHHEGDTLVLNPGAVFRANPHSIAVVDLASLDVTIAPF